MSDVSLNVAFLPFAKLISLFLRKLVFAESWFVKAEGRASPEVDINAGEMPRVAAATMHVVRKVPV